MSTDRPSVCPRCGRPTTLVNVTRVSAATIRESCQVCGRGLALVRRRQWVPESDQAPADDADGTPLAVLPGATLGARLQSLREETGESWRGSLEAQRPRRSMADMVGDLADRLELPDAFGVKARRHSTGVGGAVKWTTYPSGRPRRMTALDVPCPTCGAVPGKPCRILDGDPPEDDPRRTVNRSTPHPERHAAGVPPITTD